MQVYKTEIVSYTLNPIYLDISHEDEYKKTMLVVVRKLKLKQETTARITRES